MYISTDISVFNSIDEFAAQKEQLNNVPLLIVCHSGKLLIETAVPYSLIAGDMLLCPQGWTINKFLTSPDFEGDFYIIHKHALDELAHNVIRTKTNLWDYYRFLRDNPVIHLNERQMRIYQLSKQLRSMYLDDTDNQYQEHIFKLLLQLGVYEMFRWLDKEVLTDVQIGDKTVPRMTRKDQLTGDFIRLVVEQKGRQREVKWYADRLCVTPKYLAACVREKMSRSPHEYINEVLMVEIRRNLQHTDNTVQQIAYSLGFPTQSFFGKFVKAQTGMSPLAYRKALRKDN